MNLFESIAWILYSILFTTIFQMNFMQIWIWIFLSLDWMHRTKVRLIVWREIRYLNVWYQKMQHYLAIHMQKALANDLTLPTMEPFYKPEQTWKPKPRKRTQNYRIERTCKIVTYHNVCTLHNAHIHCSKPFIFRFSLIEFWSFICLVIHCANKT